MLIPVGRKDLHRNVIVFGKSLCESVSSTSSARDYLVGPTPDVGLFQNNITEKIVIVEPSITNYSEVQTLTTSPF